MRILVTSVREEQTRNIQASPTHKNRRQKANNKAATSNIEQQAEGSKQQRINKHPRSPAIYNNTFVDSLPSAAMSIDILFLALSFNDPMISK